jgi:pantoate--beta-alanine ligase
MKIIETVEEMRRISNELHSQGKTIGFVPTMGYLHEGHLSLIDEAKRETDTTVMSIYVNPTQFGIGEDFDRYPRDLDRDKELAEDRGVDFIFAPSDKEMYQDGHLTFVEVDKVSRILEGEFRPTHFRGVTTIVAKLFNIINPDVAVFGQKDAQQAFIVKKMVRDLNYGIKIIVSNIVREEDGLALSSRNVYLSKEQRRQASVLYRSLKLAESMIKGGNRKLPEIRAAMVRLINTEPEARIDYVSFVDPGTFERVEEVGDLCEILGLLAVRFGQTRLIDNMLFRLCEGTKDISK